MATRVVWEVVPLETPKVIRQCPRCATRRPFRSSDRFRVNANHRKIDVWLIYGCVTCDYTWNAAVIERATVDTIDKALYAGFLANDDALAWRYAFDLPWLARLGAHLDRDVDYRIEWRGPASPDDGPLEVCFVCAYPCLARTDKIVAQALGWSRKRAQAALPTRVGRRPLRDGLVVMIGA